MIRFRLLHLTESPPVEPFPVAEYCPAQRSLKLARKSRQDENGLRTDATKAPCLFSWRRTLVQYQRPRILLRRYRPVAGVTVRAQLRGLSRRQRGLPRRAGWAPVVGPRRERDNLACRQAASSHAGTCRAGCVRRGRTTRKASWATSISGGTSSIARAAKTRKVDANEPANLGLFCRGPRTPARRACGWYTP